MNLAKLPDIDTREFEWLLDTHGKPALDREALVKLIHRIVEELGLVGKIETIIVRGPDDLNEGHAQLYRQLPENAWPSPHVVLEVYPDLDRYLCENLIRHEFGHERDRHDPDMHYDPEIDNRWPPTSASFWALQLAANISLDSRLAPGGLSRQFRLQNFRRCLGSTYDAWFEELWTNPPRTWHDIEELAKRLEPLKRAY